MIGMSEVFQTQNLEKEIRIQCAVKPHAGPYRKTILCPNDCQDNESRLE